MALESTDNRKEYAGNGSSTGFSFPYYFLNEEDLKVILKNNSTLAEVVQVLTTNYTVSGEGEEAGGTVTMLVAPPSGYTLIIYRDPEITQEKDFRENDSFPAEQAEEAWDKAAMVDQRLSERIDRSLTLSEGTTSFDTTLPADIATPGAVIIVNADGDGLEMGPTADEIEDAQAEATAAAASAAAALVSEGAAAVSAVAAAASATAAQTAANSIGFRDVVFKTFADSPYTLQASDRGKMFSIDTSGGAFVFNLLAIAGLDLTTQFAIAIKKSTSDGNSITVNRASTDTIDGSTSKVHSVANSGAVYIPDTDPSPDRWTTAEFGAQAGNLTIDTFSGTGSQTAFTLSVDPGSKNNTQVYISGVYQAKGTYSVSGTTLTFDAAPASGSGNIQVVIGTTLSIGTPSDRTITSAKLAQAIMSKICDGRLTLESGVPISTSDQTAKTTIYFAPYKGNLVSLYDGSNWDLYTLSQISIAVPATTNQMYDIFLYNNAGTLTLELLAWTNDTTRATALTTQDGVYVKSGQATRRYLGSFRTTGSSGQTEDSLAKRFLWNYYNRVFRPMKVVDTGTWAYGSGTVRQSNANTANQLATVIGVAEDAIKIVAVGMAISSGGTMRAIYTGIGVGVTNAMSSNSISAADGCNSSCFGNPTAHLEVIPAVGYQFYAWLERGDGTDTQTWQGGVHASGVQPGIFGKIVA